MSYDTKKEAPKKPEKKKEKDWKDAPRWAKLKEIMKKKGK